MDTVSTSELRTNMKQVMDMVEKNHAPVTIKRLYGSDMVLMSAEDYSSLEETAYISRSPRNLQRILDALHSKEEKSLEDVRRELNI